MFSTTKALYAELGKALGTEVPAQENGSVQLTVGENTQIAIFAEDEYSLLLASPIMALPQALDYGRALWLLRRNFYDSPIAPFRIACDADGNLAVWGRVPTEGLTGDQLAKLIDALATEADFIREEIEIDETPEAEEADVAA